MLQMSPRGGPPTLARGPSADGRPDEEAGSGPARDRRGAGVRGGRRVHWEGRRGQAGSKLSGSGSFSASKPSGGGSPKPSHACDIWEKEDHGSCRQLQTGTRQVLDYYACSCGATKWLFALSRHIKMQCHSATYARRSS